MRFEYSGSIWLSNTGKKMNPFIDVVRELFEDEDDYEYYNKYLKEIDYSSNQIDVYGSRDFDDMEAMKTILMMICDKAISTYPECSLEAHYCGTSMTSGTEWAFSVNYKNHHVKKFEIEGNVDQFFCPDCDESIASYGDFRFDTELKCDECGREMTKEEILNEIADWIEEYDVEVSPKSAQDCKDEAAIEIDFDGKKFVTTGLSIEDEEWVREQVESRGGEFKPKFVVSLSYLIYNPDYDHETTKFTRAKEQIEKGKPVQIITFEQFKKSL